MNYYNYQYHYFRHRRRGSKRRSRCMMMLTMTVLIIKSHDDMNTCVNLKNMYTFVYCLSVNAIYHSKLYDAVAFFVSAYCISTNTNTSKLVYFGVNKI